ncbi:MAG TPA: hypothetical protein DDX92_12735 [Flavobacteriales bacterium]|nr:hypothetical protein [Flavobacteriales bacterium]
MKFELNTAAAREKTGIELNFLLLTWHLSKNFTLIFEMQQFTNEPPTSRRTSLPYVFKTL